MGKLFARDGGKTSEEGASRLISRLFSKSGVLEYDECKVVAASTPDNTVKIETGDLVIGNNSPSASNYYYHGWVDTQESVTIDANTSGSARIDSIVAYVDKAVQDTDNSDNPDALKFASVAGTPAGSPVAPNDAAIVAVVGAGNPYYILANVAVANGFSAITNANITDMREITQTVIRGDGWNPVSDTWSYDSATTITVPSGAESKYAVGDKISWVTGGSTKYAVITEITDTLLTVSGDAVANATITVPRHSKVNPNGYGQVRDSQINDVSASKISNPYKFKARLTSSQSINSSVDTALQFNLEEYDVNNDYNTTTAIYTAPVTGYYKVDLRIVATSSNAVLERVQAKIYKNGTVYSQATNFLFNKQFHIGESVSEDMYLEAGDTIKPYAYVAFSSGAVSIATGSYSNFSAHLISV